jgi:electron transfer flavoprotein beta subunit
LAEVEPTIRKALAIGHDDAVRINTEPADGFVVANAIAEYLRRQPYDLILFGKESINFNGAMVPAMVAELADLPAVYYATYLDIVNNQVQVRREVDGGTETVTLPMPSIVSCAKGIAEWRIAGLRGITQAKTKQIKVFNPTPTEPMTQSVKFDLPPARQGCQYFGVDDVNKLVEVLATKGAL